VVVAEDERKLKRRETDCKGAWEFDPLGASKVFPGVFLGHKELEHFPKFRKMWGLTVDDDNLLFRSILILILVTIVDPSPF
jgi:hypothetical protein